MYLNAQCNFNVDAGVDTSFCFPTNYQLNASVSGTIVNTPTYQWTPSTGLNNPNIPNPIANVTGLSTYTVTATMLSNTNLVQNGDFSGGNTGFTSDYVVGTATGSPGLLALDGTYGITTNANSVHNFFSSCIDHTTGNGNMLVVNGSSVTNQNVWCQTVTVTPNTDYNFSTWIQSVEPNSPAILQFSINGILLSTPFNASSTTCLWQQFFATWNSGANTSATICIVNQNTATNGNDFALDDIALNPVCIATDVVTLDIENVSTTIINETICPGDSYFAGGQLQTTAGTYNDTLVSNAGCDSIVVTNLSIENIAVNLGNDTTFCDGNMVVLDATNTNGTYLWQDNSINPTFSASASGLYFVDVTVGSCTIRDSLNIVVNPNPVVNLGVDTALCDVSNFPLDATTPNVTYLWQDNSTNPTFTATQSGVYAVSVTDNNNCVGTDDITLTFGTSPIVNLGNDTAICDGNTVLLDATNVGATYLWQDNSTNPTLSTNTAGTYSVDVSLAHCTTSDTINIIVNPNPSINLGIDTAFCDITSYLIDATTPNVTYLWQDGSMNSTFNATQTGNYSVTVTDNNGCEGSDDINLTFGQSPTSLLGNDTTICENTTLLLDATTSNATYLWQDNSTNPTFLVSAAGLYKVTITVGTCSIEDSIQVNIIPSPTVNIGADTALCDETSFVLDATTPNVTYLWQDNSTNPTFTATQSGVYAVTITDNTSSCTASDDINLTFSQSPIIDLGEDMTFCDNRTFTLDATTNGVTSYVWQDGSTDPTLSLNTSGIYAVTVTNAANCTASDTVTISYLPLDALNLGNDTSICLGTAITLDAFIQDATYLWQDNSTDATLTVSQAGVYSVAVLHPFGCTLTDSIQIGITLPLDPVSLPSDTTICKGQSVIFNAYQPKATAYEWIGESAFFGQNDPNDTIFNARFDGNYTVTVSNKCDAITHTIDLTVEDCSCTPYIPNAFSPNNDGVNDVFRVFSGCPIENFNLQLFDRWGNQVFQSTDIATGWDGTFRGQNVDTNIYVWRISYDTTDTSGQVVNTVLTGDITLIR